MARKIEVQILGDADSLHRALGKATDTTSRFGHVLGTGLRVAAVGAGAALVGLGYGLKRGIDDFNESQQVAAQLQAVLKSTGGQANVTAKHVNALAQSLSNMSGVDDEAIGKSENLLLTFRNVRNEAGKGNDIFDQATRATLDLSVAMGTDLRSSSILVGKALNDPVKGMTALRRVGVSLSASQEQLITHLVATGHSAQAQKIILGELTKEFGGSAKAAGDTLAGQLNKLRNAFDNAASSVIQGLLPYVTRLAQFAFPLVVSALTEVAGGIRDAIHWVDRIASRFAILGDKGTSGSQRVRNAFQALHDFFVSNVLPIIRRLQAIFTDAMANIAAAVQQHGPELQRIFNRVGAAMKAIANMALPILRFALVEVLPRAIGIAIDAIDRITSALQTVIGWFRVVANHSGPSFLDMVGPIQTAISWVNSLISKIQDLTNWINNIPALPSLNTSLLDIAGIGSVAGIGGGGGSTMGPAQGRSIHVHVDLNSREIATALVTEDKNYARQNGRGLFT